MDPLPRTFSKTHGFDTDTLSTLSSTSAVRLPDDRSADPTLFPRMESEAMADETIPTPSPTPTESANACTHAFVVTDPDGITVGVFSKNFQWHLAGSDNIARERALSRNRKRSLNEIPRRPPTPQDALPAAPSLQVEDSLELETVIRFTPRDVTPDRVIVPPRPKPVFYHTTFEGPTVCIESANLSSERTTGWVNVYPTERLRGVDRRSRGDLGGMSFSPLEESGKKGWRTLCCMQ